MIVSQQWPLAKHHDHPSIEGWLMWTSSVPIHDWLAYDLIFSSYIPYQSEA